MPASSEVNVRHLLRRTEFVDRSRRVEELLALGSLAAAVDDVLDVATDPATFTFRDGHEWHRQAEMGRFWLDQMAHDSPRPFQERLALFWHGHFCTSFEKVGVASLMQEQIDLFRRAALGNVRELAITMSTQVAMLRYLDNNRNRRSSPNQNFARELMELFLLGVGNYTEADVEAATAAWTGHTDQWDDTVSPYRWRADWHDDASKRFLGRTINRGGDPREHGAETIRVMLGNGVVPDGAAATGNRGRPTREVAAEFLARKLWRHFGGDDVPTAAVAAMRDALLSHDFAVRPCVRTMLLRDEFYSDSTRAGLVRSPVELVVAGMVATGLRSDQTPWWTMSGMGQQIFFPPNVSGWKTNGYWVNASAMDARTSAAQYFYWRSMRDYWQGDDGLLRLAGGTLARSVVTAGRAHRTMSDAELLDRVLELADLRITRRTRQAILAYAGSRNVWERIQVVLLVLLAPEMHLA